MKNYLAIFVSTLLFITVIYAAEKGYGCNGYCWSYCNFLLGGNGGEWCYTTYVNKKDSGYIKCSNKSDCPKIKDIWDGSSDEGKCKGSCALF